MNKGETKSIIPIERIERIIYAIRDQKVMLDKDLAELYGVETKNFNKAVKRNIDRFPEDFAFQLTKEEWESLRFHFGTSKKGRGGRRYPPIVFTEHGAVMAANIIKSKNAIQTSVDIVRAFIHLRQQLSTQKELIKEFSELKSFMLKHSNSNDREFRKIWQTIERLSNPPLEKNQRKIGFDLS